MVSLLIIGNPPPPQYIQLSKLTYERFTILVGLGIAAKLVSAFINALRDTIGRRGFPDDVTTYGLGNY